MEACISVPPGQIRQISKGKGPELDDVESVRNPRSIPLQTVKELLELCESVCRDIIADAMKSAGISVLAKTYMHPIAQQVDDLLIHLEIWAFDAGLGQPDADGGILLPAVLNKHYASNVFKRILARVTDIKKDVLVIRNVTADMATSSQNNRYDILNVVCFNPNISLYR